VLVSDNVIPGPFPGRGFEFSVSDLFGYTLDLNSVNGMAPIYEGKPMEYNQFILDIYVRLFKEYEMVLKGTTLEELNYRAGPQSNSMGWLLWHTIRSQDRMNADLFGEEQLWISRKWYQKFNRQPDPKETGYGHTQEQAAGFQAAEPQVYLDYYQAVFDRTRQYVLTRLSPADLQREVFSPTLGSTQTVASRIIGTINNFQHVGQAGYVKGILEGIGWYGM
jgi:hypothetical protein